MIKLLFTLITLLIPSQSFANEKITLTNRNTIYLLTAFTTESVAQVIFQAKQLDSEVKSDIPIYLVLSSPGGDVEAGLELIDALKNLNRPVHTITMTAISMGFQSVANLGTRYITRTGTMMTHHARGQFHGEFGGASPSQMDSRYKFWINRVENLDKIVVARTKGKLTLDGYHKLMENEYWCEGQQCVDVGFSDVVADVRCDKTLSGTRFEERKFIWEGLPIIVVTMLDACPLNTGELDFKVFVNGKDIFKVGNNSNIQNIKGLETKINEFRIQSNQKIKESR